MPYARLVWRQPGLSLTYLNSFALVVLRVVDRPVRSELFPVFQVSRIGEADTAKLSASRLDGPVAENPLSNCV